MKIVILNGDKFNYVLNIVLKEIWWSLNGILDLIVCFY